MDRQRLQAQLSIDEGDRLKIYVDTVGKVSIGTGRNLTDKGIHDDERLLMLSHDIDDAVADLDRGLPWWRQMNDARQNVLANMCFNMGISKLLGFKNTLAAMQKGDYAAAADGMLASTWASQVKDRATRLAKVMGTGTFE